MVVRIIIAGISQCQLFAEVCLVADYLAQNLPNLCFEHITKPVIEWENWLYKVNIKNNWHHTSSPIVWKEMIWKGSKPYLIGGASDFLEYCHSYYDFDNFFGAEDFHKLPVFLGAYQQKVTREATKIKDNEEKIAVHEKPPQLEFTVCISGAGNPLTMYLISGLLDMAVGKKSIFKIYIYDSACTREFMEYIELQCAYISTSHTTKVVRYVDKIGIALASTDLLIILDHAPFETHQPIGDWLAANKVIMTNLSLMINASASQKIYILFGNLGPACYNATVLSKLIRVPKSHVIVATSDLGLDITSKISEIAEVPLKNIFCPPVWGFVGINHLVDVNTTVHRYDSFVPYDRYLKVNNSSLTIGSLTPEIRTMEYLMYFEETFWKQVAENKTKYLKGQQGLNKMIAVLNVVKLWLFERNPDHIVSLGIQCNGSFGLTFNGKFSQPCRFSDGIWIPATKYLLPKDEQIKLNYLETMAEFTMHLEKGDLPDIRPYIPCSCKVRYT